MLSVKIDPFKHKINTKKEKMMKFEALVQVYILDITKNIHKNQNHDKPTAS